MRSLLRRFGPILVTGHREAPDQRVDDRPDVQQVPKGSKTVGFKRGGCGRRLEVGPGRGDEGLGSVGQHAQQLETAVAVHPSEQIQSLPFKGMASPDDRDRRRVPLEVGSVSPFLCR